MSKRVRKSGRRTIRASREQARAVAPHHHAPELASTRSYPSAAELFAEGSAWRSYVTDTLRSLLAPAAFVGAVGLAGCAGAGTPDGLTSSDTTTVESSATLTPLSPPTTTATTNIGDGTVVVTQLPTATLTPIPSPPGVPTPVLTSDPRPVFPTGHTIARGGAVRAVDPRVIAIQPATRPPTVRGDSPQVQPAVDPPQVEGGGRAVQPIQQPIQPTTQPPPLGGAPPPVQIVHARPQPVPHPHPPAVPGGI